MPSPSYPSRSYLGSLLAGGWFFGREAVEKLFFKREIGIDFLMLVAAAVATLMGEPLEGAMLAFLYSISEAAEVIRRKRPVRPSARSWI